MVVPVSFLFTLFTTYRLLAGCSETLVKRLLRHRAPSEVTEGHFSHTGLHSCRWLIVHRVEQSFDTADRGAVYRPPDAPFSAVPA